MAIESRGYEQAEGLRCIKMTLTRQVSVPEELCVAAEQKFGKRFGTLEAFLEFVLRDLVCDEARALDESEQAMVERRLRDLGYL